MTARFLQVHSLASYPAVLLNRDDTGAAKRLPYGGASRIRISSQCLKRHWRKAEDEWALRAIELPMAERSREIVESRITPRLAGRPEAVVEAVQTGLIKLLYGKDNVERRKRQALLLGTPEIEYLARAAEEAAATGTVAAAEAHLDKVFGKRESKGNLKVLLDAARDVPAGLETAMFGRMVTSDPLANIDAAIHVAHAFTVHAEESESDYFTVVDDLAEAGETGSAGIFESELTSGLFYSYVVIDIEALAANLGGERRHVSKTIEHLLHLIATVSPGAKKGSTAPYAYASLMLVEAGRRQPRSLAGAFREPVPLAEQDLLKQSIARLLHELSRFDAAYGGAEERAALSVLGEDLPGIGAPTSLDSLAAWAATQVGEAA